MAKKNISLVKCSDCKHRGTFSNYMWHCDIFGIGRSTKSRECLKFKNNEQKQNVQDHTLP